MDVIQGLSSHLAMNEEEKPEITAENLIFVQSHTSSLFFEGRGNNGRVVQVSRQPHLRKPVQYSVGQNLSAMQAKGNILLQRVPLRE